MVELLTCKLTNIFRIIVLEEEKKAVCKELFLRKQKRKRFVLLFPRFALPLLIEQM